MKSLIGKTYDKIILTLVLLGLAFCVIWSFTGKDIPLGFEKAGTTTDHWERSAGGISYESKISLGLMPGDLLYVMSKSKGDQNVSGVKISKSNFKRRAPILLELVNGDIWEGKVKSKEGITLGENWSRSNQAIVIDTDDGPKTIQQKQISKITGEAKYFLSEDEELKKFKSLKTFFYQRNKAKNQLPQNLSGSPWKEVEREQNGTLYDLFTPPLIYIIDGKLTTSLPEATVEEEKEDFGVTISSFSSMPYRFRLSSWIGNNPYFEDTVLSKSFGRKIRTRLDVNASYKLASSPKPGQPSLVATTYEDPDKFLTLKFFTTQNVKQKTGGIRPVGRALVEDKSVKDEPFEINSLMDEVYLGQFMMKLRIELKDKDALDLDLTERDTGREIDYYGRKYKIISFDTDRRSVKISKQIGLAGTVEENEMFAP